MSNKEKKKKKISTSYIPQTKYRKLSTKDLVQLNTTIIPIGKNYSQKDLITEKLNHFIQLVHHIVFESELNNDSLRKKICQQLFNDTTDKISNRIDEVWLLIESGIINFIKVSYLERYIDILLSTFEKRLSFVINKYKRFLPKHISTTEGEDLTTIAQLELIETFKAWNPVKSEDLWPLAYSRVNGAMKDHIRYISKSDPSRFYDWVASAAQLYLSINKSPSYESKIENSSELDRALKVLNEKEKRVVILYVNKDLTFSDIAKKMKLSESQISRIYKKAVEKIKTVLT